MRRELLVFAVDPAIRTLQADPDVARLVTWLLGTVGTVDGVFASESGDELAVVVEVDDDAPAPVLDTTPRLRLRSRLVRPHAPGSGSPPAVPVPPVVKPDPTTVDPRPAPWQELVVGPDGGAVATFTRGVVERLHSVEARFDASGALHVTVLVGRVPGATTGPVVALGIVERAAVRLPFAVSPA